MAVTCPNNCEGLSATVNIIVEPAQFLKVVLNHYRGRDGIEDIDACVRDGTPQLRICVDQNAYETANYFYGRRYLETRPATITDIGDDVVRIEFDGINTVMADHCLQCGAITHSELGDLSQYDEYDPSADEDWIAAELA